MITTSCRCKFCATLERGVAQLATMPEPFHSCGVPFDFPGGRFWLAIVAHDWVILAAEALEVDAYRLLNIDIPADVKTLVALAKRNDGELFDHLSAFVAAHQKLMAAFAVLDEKAH